MRTLPPQRLTASAWKDIEAQLKQLFYEIIFVPVLAIVHKKNAQPVELKNAPGTSLMVAIRTGRVQYSAGKFTGKFNVAISNDIRRLGGEFNSRDKTFSIVDGVVPESLKVEAANYLMTAKAAHDEILRKLLEVQDRLDERLAKYDIDPYGAMEHIEHGFRKSAEALKVSPQLDDARKAQLAKIYNENLKLPIKDFARQSITQLREATEENSIEGYRFDRLINVIRQRYGVTANKAKFLARQETGLFMAKYRRQRFDQAGVTHYKWSTAHDERVRDSHKDLNGRIFSYDSPPVTDRHTMAHNNPGEDFNCFPAESGVDFVAGIEKGFRRWYSGELTEVVMETGETIRATPNHPVLTLNGWKPIGLINQCDEIVELVDNRFFTRELNGNKRVTAIGQIFESLRESGLGLSFPGERSQFHGDGSDNNVDVVGATGNLRGNWKATFAKFREKFQLAMAQSFALSGGDLLQHERPFLFGNGLSPSMRSGSQSLSFFKTHPAHSDFIGLGDSADGDIGFQQSPTNDDTFKACTFRNGKLTLSREISINDRFWIELQSVLRVKRRTVIRTQRIPFSGHVFNLQSKYGYYTIGGVIVSNCRCLDIPILDKITEFL